jgi:signal peptidase I
MLDEQTVVVQQTVAAPKAPAVAPALKVEAKPTGSWFQKYSLVLLFVTLLSIPAYFLASRFVVTAVVVQGRSMMPTLKDGERYYLNRWRYLFVAPQCGEIVVIRDPGHSDLAVKRIVAQPFDWINLKNGNIYINGRRLDESYLAQGTRTEAPDLKEKWIQLGQDQYYVMGDNRANSVDSRDSVAHGPVPVTKLIGRVTDIAFSPALNRMGRWIGTPGHL